MKINKMLKNIKKEILALIIVILVVLSANFIFYNTFFRFDITKNNKYSISDSSKKIIKKLDDIVNIKLYISKDLPQNLIQSENQLNNILNEYKYLSKNKIVISREDVTNDDVKKEIEEFKIPQLQVNTINNDKIELKNIYFGVVILFKNKSEIIPVINNIGNIEYDITSRILKLERIEKYNIALYMSTENKSRFSFFQKYIEENYDFYNIDINNIELKQKTKNIILFLDNENINKNEIEKIKKYINEGGSVLVFSNQVGINENFIAEENKNNNINNLLNLYGININSDLVLDDSNIQVPFSDSGSQYLINYPLFVKALKENLNNANNIFNNLDNISFPFTSSITLDNNIKENNYTIKSTKQSWNEIDNFDLDPNKDFSKYERKENILGAYHGYGNSKIYTFGTSRFVEDSFLQSYVENYIFLENIIDNLTIGDSLVNIRSKNIENNSIKQISNSYKTLFIAVNIFLPVISIIFFGSILFIKNKKEKEYFIKNLNETN